MAVGISEPMPNIPMGAADSIGPFDTISTDILMLGGRSLERTLAPASALWIQSAKPVPGPQPLHAA
jgi:hypothetical protein